MIEETFVHWVSDPTKIKRTDYLLMLHMTRMATNHLATLAREAGCTPTDILEYTYDPNAADVHMEFGMKDGVFSINLVSSHEKKQ